MDIAWQIRLGAYAGLGCAVALLAIGCASPDAIVLDDEARVTGPAVFAGNQGGAWEAIFTPVLEQARAGEEMTRRDAELNIREPQAITELGMWPEHPRPRLGQTRRLFLPRRADDVIYFREGLQPFYHRTRWVWY